MVPTVRLRVVLLLIAVACVMAAASVVARGASLSQQGATPLSSIDLASPGMPARLPLSSRPLEVLLSTSASGSGAIPAPPTPTSVPRLPDWVQNRQETALWPAPHARAVPADEVPQGSPLKVIGSSLNRLLVYYAGDGGKRRAGEGWVDASDVSPAAAPRWVLTRQGTGLRSAAGSSSQVIAWLQSRTVLEVLEDRGADLRVFYPGDARTRPMTDGWVAADDVVAAGAALAAEGRGVKLLTQAEAASLVADGLWLRVPYRSQLDGSRSADANCGPASIGMAIEFFGTYVRTAELRMAAERLQGTSDPDSGFAIEFLQGAVERYGLMGSDLYAGATFKRWTLEDVRRHLRSGHPVIPQLRYRLMPGRGNSDYGEDHYVVLSGLRGEEFVYDDAVDADGPGYGRSMSAEALTRAWGASYFPFAAFAVSRP